MNQAEIRKELHFETERLVGRSWRIEDADEAFAIYGNREVYADEPNILMEGIEQMRVKLEQIVQRDAGFPNGLGSYATIEKESGRIAGNLILKALPDADGNSTDNIEIGWHLHQDFWGRGYATEGANELLRIGFENVGLSEIFAVCRTDNEKSMAVMRRIGLKHLGQTDKFLFAFAGVLAHW